MLLTDLPLDVFVAIIDRMVILLDIPEGLQLRLVSRLFDREVQRACFASGLRDYTANPKTFGQMSKVNAARHLLYMIGKKGSQIPWLGRLQNAAALLCDIARAKNRELSVQGASCDDVLAQEKTVAVCLSVAEYLGAEEILYSLSDEHQYMCNHPWSEYRINYEYFCHRRGCNDCNEPSGRLRRSESALGWATLVATHLGDESTLHHLLGEHKSQLGENIELTPSLVLSARLGNEKIFRFLLDAGADVNSFGHSFADGYSVMSYGSALEGACVGGKVDIVKVLLNPRYKLANSGSAFERAVFLAAENKTEHEASTEIFHLLLDNMTSPLENGTFKRIFKATCFSGNEALARFIFEQYPFGVYGSIGSNDRVPHRYYNVLYVAAENGHANIATLLLASGQYRLRPVDGSGNPTHIEHSATVYAFLRAFECGSLEVAALLWDVSFYTKKLPYELLDEAAKYGHVHMIKFLLTKGIDLWSSPGSGESYGERALVLAIRGAYVPATRFLLQIGFRTNKLERFQRPSPRAHFDEILPLTDKQAVENILHEYGLGPVPVEDKF